MVLEQGEDGDRVVFNALFRALRAPVRRRILFSLLDHNPQEALMIPEDVHVGERALTELHTELAHSHLPLLEEAGFIRWDKDANQLHKGPEFGQFRELLESIREHDPMVTEE